MGTHLWFVLTDPNPATQLVVLVALVSERSHTDKTVTLNAGDHPFISHTSNVDYGLAKFAPAAKLNEVIAARRASLHTDMSAALLATVREGLLASSHTPHAMVDYCRPQFQPRKPRRRL